MARVGGLDAALGALLSGLAALTVLAPGDPLVEGASWTACCWRCWRWRRLAASSGAAAAEAFQHLESNLEAARRLFDLVDAAPAVIDPPNPLPPPAAATWSCATCASATRRRPPALDGISFTLPHGRHAGDRRRERRGSKSTW